jgi:hypothetical protein
MLSGRDVVCTASNKLNGADFNGEVVPVNNTDCSCKCILYLVRLSWNARNVAVSSRKRMVCAGNSHRKIIKLFTRATLLLIWKSLAQIIAFDSEGKVFPAL